MIEKKYGIRFLRKNKIGNEDYGLLLTQTWGESAS